MTSFYKKLFVSEITDKSIFERKRIIKCVNIPEEVKAGALNNDTYSSAKFMRTGFDRETSRNKSAQQVGELAKRELVINASCLHIHPGVETTNDKHIILNR